MYMYTKHGPLHKPGLQVTSRKIVRQKREVILALYLDNLRNNDSYKPLKNSVGSNTGYGLLLELNLNP